MGYEPQGQVAGLIATVNGWGIEALFLHPTGAKAKKLRPSRAHRFYLRKAIPLLLPFTAVIHTLERKKWADAVCPFNGSFIDLVPVAGCTSGLCCCLRSGLSGGNSRVGVEALTGAPPLGRAPLLEDYVSHRVGSGCTDKAGEL